MTPHILEKDKEQKEEVTWRTYDVAEYDRLSASYEDPVTAILDRVYSKKQRCYKYKVRWEGYGASDDT